MMCSVVTLCQPTSVIIQFSHLQFTPEYCLFLFVIRYTRWQHNRILSYPLPLPVTIMAAPVTFSRNICSLTRIFSGFPQLGLRSLSACRDHRSCQTIRSQLPSSSRASLHTASSLALASSPITVTDEPDTLLQKVSVLVKGHDRSVLDSYEFFATMAAKELGITHGNVFEPPKDIERLTLLKSIHIFKKHRVQYEMRTHYRCLELFRVTGSTAQVYLEYIQRNLPEGVAMEVSKISIVKVPEHILEPMWEEPPTDNMPSP